jgi:hypothetical protein
MLFSREAILRRLTSLESRMLAVEKHRGELETVSALHAISASLTNLAKEIIRMDQSLQDLKDAFTAYAAKVDAYVAAMEAFKLTVDQAVAAAVAADDAAEAFDIGVLKADIEAALAKVPDAPVAPPFDPSANA